MIREDPKKYLTKKYPPPDRGYPARYYTIRWEARLTGNYFAITGEVCSKRWPSNPVACGCLHEGWIDKVELTDKDALLPGLLKWHLMGYDGPMHYVANAVYHFERGEVERFKNGILFGEVDGDEMPTDKNYVEQFLSRRLPALLSKFEADMVSLFGEGVRC